MFSTGMNSLSPPAYSSATQSCWLLPTGMGSRPEIAPDAVLDMDHQIAARKRLKFGEEGVGILALLLAPHQPVTEHVLLGQEFERVAGKAGFERQHQHRDLGFGGKAEALLPACRPARWARRPLRGSRRCAARCRWNRPRTAACARLGNRLQMCGGGLVNILAAPAFRARNRGPNGSRNRSSPAASFAGKAGGAVGRQPWPAPASNSARVR